MATKFKFEIESDGLTNAQALCLSNFVASLQANSELGPHVVNGGYPEMQNRVLETDEVVKHNTPVKKRASKIAENPVQLIKRLIDKNEALKTEEHLENEEAEKQAYYSKKATEQEATEQEATEQEENYESKQHLAKRKEAERKAYQEQEASENIEETDEEIWESNIKAAKEVARIKQAMETKHEAMMAGLEADEKKREEDTQRALNPEQEAPKGEGSPVTLETLKRLVSAKQASHRDAIKAYFAKRDGARTSTLPEKFYEEFHDLLTALS
jgi:flagellar biosynthesis GTPase FlhF